MDSRAQIENLIARYCRYYDKGDLDSYAELFKYATISGMSTKEEIIDFHQKNIYFYDGEPKTRHVISNVEIYIDEDAGTATGRCYLVIYQALPDFPLQPLLIGSYVDKYHRIDGEWYFAERKFQEHLRGDSSRHGRPDTQLPDAR